MRNRLLSDAELLHMRMRSKELDLEREAEVLEEEKRRLLREVKLLREKQTHPA